MKDKKEIQQLLDRFMAAETSEQEELQLASWFREAEEIPEEWRSYKAMFGAFQSGALAFSETELDSFARPKKRTVFSLVYRWAAAAAVAVLLLGLGFAWQGNHTQRNASVTPSGKENKNIASSGHNNMKATPQEQPETQPQSLPKHYKTKKFVAKAETKTETPIANEAEVEMEAAEQFETYERFFEHEVMLSIAARIEQMENNGIEMHRELGMT